MSSPTYVTQNEYPLDDDTTLMSTTDVHSYITHANDTFVQVSGYQLDELTGQPHNMVRHPDMPKAAFADMWYTLQQGEPWSGIVKNRRKNGDHYWVRANAVPMVRQGQVTGYMSIRTRAKAEEIAAVEPLYKEYRYADALPYLKELTAPINDYLDNVMVMVKDEAVKDNRISQLLKTLSFFDAWGDFSKLV